MQAIARLTQRNLVAVTGRCYRFSTKSQSVSSEIHVRNLVREQDREHFISSIFFPNDVRRHFLAVRAFHVEIARVLASSRSNTTAATMRFQWWKSVVDSIYSNSSEGPAESDVFRDNPVASELAYAVEVCKLSKRWLMRPIDTRIASVEEGASNSPPATMFDAEMYAEAIQTSGIYSALEVVGVRNEQADIAASYIGRAQGLLLTLRSAPYQVASGQPTMIPIEILQQSQGSSDTSPENNSNDENNANTQNYASERTNQQNDKIRSASKYIVEAAQEDLNDARSVINGKYEGYDKKVDARAIPALLPLISLQLYINRLKYNNYDILHPELLASKLPLVKLQLKMLWASWRKQL